MDGFRVQATGPSALRLVGDLDLLAAEELGKLLLPMCEVSGAVVELDLRDVSFVDSTGIALLLRAHRRADEHGARLQVAAPAPAVERVLHATGADEILHLG
jgi:anti-sigma B factor antagonist